MADKERTDVVPQVGTHFGGESHPSSEGLPVDSGEGNLLPATQEHALVTITGVMEVEDLAGVLPLHSSSFSSSATLPTEGDLDAVHKAVAEGFRPIDSSIVSGVDASMDSSMDLDDTRDDSAHEPLNCNLQLPSRVRKQLVREKKEAEGTWLPLHEWRRSQGLKRRRTRGLGSARADPAAGGDPIPGGPFTSGGNARSAAPPKVDRPTVAKRTRRWDQGPASAVSSAVAGKDSSNRPSFREQLTSFKMAVVPEAFPEAKLTNDDCSLLQEKLLEKVWSDTDTSTPLQVLSTYMERGALVVTCGNKETRDWLLAYGSGLGPVGEGGAMLIVGDYKDLLRSTKALLRVDKLLAKKDPADVLGHIERQNPGITTKDWRIIGVKKEEDHQTLVLTIDELSSQVLKGRDWRIFLGISRMQLRVIKCGLDDDQGHPS